MPEQHYEGAPPPAASQPSRKAAKARRCSSSLGDLPGEDVTVDGGEDQAPEFGRLQRLHLPQHRASESKPWRRAKAGHLGSPRLPSVAGSWEAWTCS
ncbi:hypothetical protein [Streptomyces sp. PanSC9]|uniref:hypothetical protein n=1 Tax=Streptomyces sp. PanSC9 TaxID=1520461 RepID=UPI00161897CE|nr:hypothetical protein [Streptomyces sp. PanSC9]